MIGRMGLSRDAAYFVLAMIQRSDRFHILKLYCLQLAVATLAGQQTCLIRDDERSCFAVGAFNRGTSESRIRVEVPYRYRELERSTCEICAGWSFHRGFTRNNYVAETRTCVLEYPRSSAAHDVRPRNAAR